MSTTITAIPNELRIAEQRSRESRRDQPHRPQDGVTLRGLFRAHRGRMLLTYALFNIESLLKLAQPFVLGLAINDLLTGSYVGLLIFVAQHVSHMGISRWRQRYDTRVFNELHALIVHHAKYYCRKRPRCGECCLVDECPAAQLIE